MSTHQGDEKRMTETESNSSELLDYSNELDTDLYLYSGMISDEGVNRLIHSVLNIPQKKSVISLILCTYGGDPNAAFRLARFAQSAYSRFRILVTGPCKSAGTLVVTGADELVMSITGELGPLDIQLAKPDELMSYGSGLDALRAYDDLSQNYFETFSSFLIQTLDRSGGAISTKTACDFASRLVADLVQPIAAQIDPYRLAEVRRAMDLAREYGRRLDRGNLRMFALEHLVESYPAHGFVIDKEEAKALFANVAGFGIEEYQLAVMAAPGASEPSSDILVMDLMEMVKSNGKNNGQSNGAPRGAAGDVGGDGPTGRSEADAGVAGPAKKTAKRRKANAGGPKKSGEGID